MVRVLSDEQWSLIEAGLAEVGPRRAKDRIDDRQTIDAIVWRFRTGSPWRDIPSELGHWNNAYQRFRRWAVAGVWERLFDWSRRHGGAELGMASMDGTIMRAHQKAAGARPARTSPVPAAGVQALGVAPETAPASGPERGRGC